MAVVKLPTLHIRGISADGESVVVGSRTSCDPSDDYLLIYKSLEFRDAARREHAQQKPGRRAFVCALVPAWKRPLLRLLGIKARDITP